MSKLHSVLLKFVPFILLVSLSSPRVFAQATNSQPRIAAAVNDAQTTVLRGNTHPFARAEFDRGVAPATLPMQHMLMVLQRSPAQEAALESFMAEQLDPHSANFHHWLTAEEFGELYGPAQQDINTITKWLASHGFQVEVVDAGRTAIQFSGTAGEVQSAFHTSIHQYQVKGEQHWANSSDPAIPTALTPVVEGVRSLHNFVPKPANHVRKMSAVHPSFSFNNGSACDIASSSNTCFTVGAADFATIYNVQTLYNGSVNGSGQTIGIVADSDVNPTDITQFRALFGLTGGAFNRVFPGANPGKNADEVEAALDSEWSGAVAPSATIDLVVSPSTNTTFGGDTSSMYIINCQTTGPSCPTAVPASILSESFGECELGLGTSGNAFYNTMWQQAASEGITVLIATGDNGSASCDIDEVNGPITQPATNGLQVNGIASTPYDVAVGGTDFNDIGSQSLYWSTANGANAVSAQKYVPESTWNDTCTNAQVFPLIDVNPPVTDPVTSCSNAEVQSNDLVEVTGGSGGTSNCTTSNGNSTSSCSGGYAQPCWQGGAITGTCTAHSGITTPGATRDLPDVSLFAGDGFAGSFYVMCQMDTANGGFIGGGQGNGACTLGASPVFVGVGGTSVSVQAFAGIMALIDQKHGARQGNANPILYALAASQSGLSCNSSSPGATCYFNDITVGTNAMPCAPGSPNCSTAASLPGIPFGRNLRISVRAIRIACALCIGLLLMLAFRRRTQRWTTAAAMSGALLLMAVSIGCGGGGGGNTNPNGTPEGVLTGFSAGTGYDQATGLGTINAANLVNATMWAGAPAPVNEPPTSFNRPTATVTTTAIFCALLLSLLLMGARKRQIRWSTAVLLALFALSILNAATTSASTRVNTPRDGHGTQRRLVSQVVSPLHH
jgi:subtilase family serine protease